MIDQKLVSMALKARENSYSPYSKFRVGAALLTEDNSIYEGCNIEFASFDGTTCAERTALLKAVFDGHRKFKKIAIASDSENLIFPCGICRQMLSEFGTDVEILAADSNGNYKIFTLKELLPHAFEAENFM